MTGLVEGLLKDALDETVSVATLLRRMQLAASRLGLEDIEGWVEQELNGYTGELPSYRSVTGQPAALADGIWQPVFTHGSGLVSEALTTAPIRQSVATLQDALTTYDKNLHLPLPDGLTRELNPVLDYPADRLVIQVGRGHVVAILEAVRNRIFQWALALDKRGIVGEGLSFSEKEKSRAQESGTVIQVGSIENFAGNIGVGNEAAFVHTTEISKFIQRIEENLPDLERDGADRRSLERLINELSEELQLKEPNRGRLKQLIIDVRSALAGAAGNLTAQGVLQAIEGILKWL